MNATAQENTSTLTLPGGGSIEIPMPGAKARFAIRPPSALSAADGCPRILPLIAIGIVVGVAGTAAAAWYLTRRR